MLPPGYIPATSSEMDDGPRGPEKAEFIDLYTTGSLFLEGLGRVAKWGTK